MPKFFAKFPGVKYLLYTPSYHSLHHSRVHTNFCLFMPIYDYAYGTMDKTSEDLYDKAIESEVKRHGCGVYGARNGVVEHVSLTICV